MVLGERAGNCSLEEVVMAIKLREKFLNGLYTDIVAKKYRSHINAGFKDLQ